MRFRDLPVVAPVTLAALLASSCGEPPEPDMRASQSVAAAAATEDLAVYAPRIPAPASDVAALYFTAQDRSGQGDRLLGASTRAARRTMLHRSVTRGERTRMLPAADGIPIPAQGELALEPGGYHVMRADLAQPLEEGDSVEVELQFQRAGRLVLRVPVVAASEAARPARRVEPR
jgi:copper(I)-binding protein